MKTILLFIFFLASYVSALGQDSVWIKSIDHYNMLAQKSAISGKFQDALMYADSVYQLCLKLKNPRRLLASKSLKGKLYQAMGKNEEAYSFFQEALELVDDVPEEDFNESFSPSNAKANMYKDLIKLFHRQQNMDSMVVYCNKINHLPCNEGTLWAKDYVVTLFREQREFKKALEIGHEVLNCYHADLENKHLIPKIMLSLAQVYSELGEHEVAIVYLDSTLKIAESIKDSFAILLSYEQLGLEFGAIGNDKKALNWHKKSIEIAEKLPEYLSLHRVSTVQVIVPLSALYVNLSQTYKNMNNIDSAKYYAQKSLTVAYQRGRYDNVSNSLISLANLTIDEGNDYQAALDSLDKAYRIAPRYRDWLFRQLDIYLAKGKIYTQKNNRDSILYYYNKAEKTALKLGVVDRLVATYQRLEDFYLQQENYAKAYTYQALKVAQENKMKDRMTQNSILGFEIKYDSEKLKLANLELAKNQEIQAKEIAFTKALNTRNKSIIIGLVFLILLLGSIAWLLYRQKRIQHQFRIMELEQKALKAQINPHFFFNVLNSLQATILSEKPTVAYKYHAKFTKLMRLILMQSNKDSISLKEELEALKLYIELEQLRTGNAFDFEIINELDSNEELMVPSMLLQPFVENAIWHGVMNRRKEVQKKITIRVHKNNNSIVCQIEDTGVGRERAQQIKQQKTKQHESMGIEVTKNRLELFQLRYNTPLRFSIQDIKNAQQEVEGTKVDLEIPIINKHNV